MKDDKNFVCDATLFKWWFFVTQPPWFQMLHNCHCVILSISELEFLLVLTHYKFLRVNRRRIKMWNCSFLTSSWTVVPHVVEDLPQDESWNRRWSVTLMLQQQCKRKTLYEVCSPRCISEANGVSNLQGCCGIATISSWNCWRSPLLSWAATSLHKTMQRIIIFKVFHYGRLTLDNSDLTL